MAASARKKALVLSPETPYPLHGGGALRTSSLLNYLARDYDIDLIVFRHLPEQDPGGALPRGLVQRVQVVDLPFHRKDLASRTARNLWRVIRGVPPLVDRFHGHLDCFQLAAHYDLSVIEHFWCASYLEPLRPISERIILNLHNVESALHESCASAELAPASLAHSYFAAKSRHLEAMWLPRFDAILAASEDDAQRIRHLAQPIVYPNSIPFAPLPQRREENVIAFSGNLEYLPNRIAVEFFAKSVWPELSARNPTLKWRLIGMNPAGVEKTIRGLDRVETTGSVVDAIRELAAAKVVVAPLLSGSGTRLKIIEAWAAGRAVVSTKLGAEGLKARDGCEICIADNPRQLIDSIQSLIASPDNRRKMETAGRDLFEKYYSWAAAWTVLDSSEFFRV